MAWNSKCRIISSLNYFFCVCILYIASKSMSTIYEDTLLHSLEFPLGASIWLRHNIQCSYPAVQCTGRFPDAYAAPEGEACRLRGRVRTDLAISLSRSSRGGLLGGRWESTWNFVRLRAKNAGKKKNQGCQKRIKKHSINVNFYPLSK